MISENKSDLSDENQKSGDSFGGLHMDAHPRDWDGCGSTPRPQEGRPTGIR
jgi:hypothetical protein